MDKQLFLILHDIRSAYNVGAIFRTADGAGVSKIYLSGYTPCPNLQSEDEGQKLSRKDREEKTRAEKMIEKTALGAEKSVAWEKADELENIIDELHAQGVAIVALEKTDEAVDIKKFTPSFPMALVVGNEVDGVDGQVMQKCDAVISLPMRGIKESLNVSVAAGIAMYELLA